jgi:hypothetical protein
VQNYLASQPHRQPSRISYQAARSLDDLALNAVRCSQSNAFLKNSRSRSPRSIPTQLYLYQHARAAPSSRAHTIAYDGQVTAEMMDTPRRAPGVGRRAKANG